MLNDTRRRPLETLLPEEEKRSREQPQNPMKITRFEDLECWQIYDQASNEIQIIDGLLRYLRSQRTK